MLWTRTSRSHDISGPVDEVSVLVVLDGGARAGTLQVAPPPPESPGRHEPPRAARAAPTSHHAPQAPRHKHEERHAIATTRVVLYPTIKQWNGCPSDKRQLVLCVVHAVRWRTGGRCGAALAADAGARPGPGPPRRR